MSFEDPTGSKDQRRRAVRAAIAGAMVGGAIVGAKTGYEKAEANVHMLSLEAIDELKERHGATHEEVSELERRLKGLLESELLRVRQRRQKN